MRNGVADGSAEGEQEDAAADVESDTEQKVTDNPSVVQGANDENELGNDIDDNDDKRVDKVRDEQTRCVLVVQRPPALESCGGNDEADPADDQAAETQGLESAATPNERELTQRLIGVPSSYSWKPTKPFTRRHQYSAPMAPA